MFFKPSRLFIGVLLAVSSFSPLVISSQATTSVLPATPPVATSPPTATAAPTPSPTAAPTATPTPKPTQTPKPTPTPKTKSSKRGNRKPKPHIASVILARRFVNGVPQEITTTFKPGDRTIHCVVKFTSITMIQSLCFVLTAVDAGGVKNYKILDETMPPQILDTAHFKTSLPRDWPAGKYRVDILLDGKFNRNLTYIVVDKQ